MVLQYAAIHLIRTLYRLQQQDEATALSQRKPPPSPRRSKYVRSQAHIKWMLLLYHGDVDAVKGIRGRESAAPALVVAARVAAITATSPGRDNTDRRILAR